MRATPITRIARVLHLVVVALTVGLLTGFPIAVESMIEGNPTVSAVTFNNVPAQTSAAETRDRSVETLVVVRHAEKPAEGLGLLTCKGLNRALLLPDFFAANFERPDHIFAPNPAVKVTEIHGDGQRYDYVRPLVTIAPTAIRLGVPINTQLPFNDPGLLADTLLDASYHKDTIYVVWEHLNLVEFAEIVLSALTTRPRSLSGSTAITRPFMFLESIGSKPPH